MVSAIASGNRPRNIAIWPSRRLAVGSLGILAESLRQLDLRLRLQFQPNHQLGDEQVRGR